LLAELVLNGFASTDTEPMIAGKLVKVRRFKIADVGRQALIRQNR
jgi:hypothetical protein